MKSIKSKLKIFGKTVLFSIDMFKNNILKYKYRFVSQKLNSRNKFTVISAVYGVEKYLEEYFLSFLNQSINFKKNITLIMIDDGSTDNSADIIKKWQKKYPKNIIYIKKENGGQSSARNLGLEYVDTKWVTFIDPDDFISVNYFFEVDKFISTNQAKKLAMIACNFIFYNEKNKKYKNTHPLKYKYCKNTNIVKTNKMDDNIQLTVTNVFFDFNILKQSQITFKDIKPSFEDAHFLNRYLLYIDNDINHIAFLKKPMYFYRKRADGSSTLDGAWRKKERYGEVLRNGYIDLLREADKTKGCIPKYIQRTVLYDIVWYLQYLINQKQKISFLNDIEKKEFNNLLREIFEYIENDTIITFELADIRFFHKIGLLGIMKQSTPGFQIIYIENYNFKTKELKMKYFNYYEEEINILIDGVITKPIRNEKIKHEFLSNLFVNEYILWLPIDKKNLDIRCQNIKKTILFNIPNKLPNLPTVNIGDIIKKI